MIYSLEFYIHFQFTFSASPSNTFGVHVIYNEQFLSPRFNYKISCAPSHTRGDVISHIFLNLMYGIRLFRMRCHN